MVDIKSTSNAVWWIKSPKLQRASEARLGSKLCKDMTDLFRHISLHGYNKLVDAGLFSYEKFIWLCLHVTIFGFMCVALTFTWDQFVLQHFSINLHDPLYPVENVPFPAVSICSNNRISRKAAENYAEELSKLDPANRSVEHFITHIKYFSSFYAQYDRSDNYEAYGEFQKFLDHYGTSDNETFYNVLDVMSKLTPPCENLILSCMLGAKKIKCFEADTFQTRLTMYGPCCMFNSNDGLFYTISRPYWKLHLHDLTDYLEVLIIRQLYLQLAQCVPVDAKLLAVGYRRRSYRTRFAGSDMGLIVILNTTHSDDTVSLLNMDGYAVIVHSSNKFPDISSGSSLEVFPNVNEETFIALRANVMDSDENLRTFATSHRRCYFDDETPFSHLLVNNRYSMANCITRCRARSVIALCNCIPFYTPLRLIGDTEGVPFCTLSNIECMQQYKFKWRNVLNEQVEIVGLERESEEALNCPQCMPSCDDVNYEISMMSLPADRFSLPQGVDEIHVDFNKSEISVLRLFFGDATVPYYKRVVTNTWVEALIKWRYVLTERRMGVMGLEREREEALFCPQCQPSCDEIRYSLTMKSLPADHMSLPEGLDIANLNFNTSDISILRVFFADATAPFYMRVMTNEWVDSLCTVGNIVSICMGFSLVALLEILYFILKYIFVALKKYIVDSANHTKWRNAKHLKKDQLYICP